MTIIFIFFEKLNRMEYKKLQLKILNTYFFLSKKLGNCRIIWLITNYLYLEHVDLYEK